LATVRRYLVRQRIVTSVSKEHLGRILASMGITAQRTRTDHCRRSDPRRPASAAPAQATVGFRARLRIPLASFVVRVDGDEMRVGHDR
jgi:hypothetical protein